LFTNALINVILLGLLGFALGYWAARNKSPHRRVLTGIVVGLAVFTTPTVIGVIGR
jgi:ABC-type molybdate transport system permease subunit